MDDERFIHGPNLGAPDFITELDAQALWPHAADKVAVRNLSLVANAGFDIWGRKKEQPLQISVTLAIRAPFKTAASSDKVDSSTVHYGTLSKNILHAVSSASSKNWLDEWTLGSVISAAILETAAKKNKTLEASAIEVHFPKGSTLGAGAGVSWKIFYRSPEQVHDKRIIDKVAPCLHLRDVRVPTLIGVNSNEREKKQVVVLNVWVDNFAFDLLEEYYDMESWLVELMEKSSFETLEALAEQLAMKCLSGFEVPLPNPQEGYPSVRIRLEKPSAVPLADAPMIEISRVWGYWATAASQ
ncbi:Dihydroneopterin aldolase-domain-containing protein [Phyllosticta paracitricarpa]|uniref:dihydroneopterin aldolase n=1 Tax=Phyllosticta paracitricarpa TaxID=2016321 RepID=A0ABR1N2X1_9PEZI